MWTFHARTARMDSATGGGRVNRRWRVLAPFPTGINLVARNRRFSAETTAPLRGRVKGDGQADRADFDARAEAHARQAAEHDRGVVEGVGHCLLLIPPAASGWIGRCRSLPQDFTTAPENYSPSAFARSRPILNSSTRY